LLAFDLFWIGETPVTTTLKIHAAMLLSVAVWCVAAAPSRADLVLANTATASFIDGAGWLAGGSFGTLTLNNSSTSAYQLTSITVELQNNSPTSTANKFGVIFNGGPVVPYNRTTLAGGEARPEIFSMSLLNFVVEPGSGTSTLTFMTVDAQSDLALKFSTGGYDFTGSPWSGSQFQSTFGSSASGPNSMYFAFALEAIPVPEPSTWAMGFACLMAAAGGRRRAARRTRWVERQPCVRRYGVR
jgi:hypothetical protein